MTDTDQPLLGPRDVLGIGERTLRNLDFIKEAAPRSGDGPPHYVTQIFLSALGVFVLPWERYFKGAVDLFNQRGWEPELDNAPPRIDLLEHLRNAIAHGRVQFSGPERSPGDVVIEFEDKPNRPGAEVNWRLKVTAADLEDLLLELAEALPELKFDGDWAPPPSK